MKKKLVLVKAKIILRDMSKLEQNPKHYNFSGEILFFLFSISSKAVFQSMEETGK